MTQTIGDGLAALRSAMEGIVLIPGDGDAYDDGRRVWNGGIDRRPGVIARCASTADVVAAVDFAREYNLELAVRGGAHNTSGTAVCDGGLMIDLSRLNAVTVDPGARTALVGGGALLGDVDAACQAHGLAVPAGVVSHTGVGGLTLGGGMGWLTPKLGLTIDNLLSAEVVLADGRVVRAAADEHPDLFWALRGGGGNFGVVTRFEFRLHEVGPMIDFALLFWSLEKGADVLTHVRDVVAGLPEDISSAILLMNAPPAPFVPEQHHFAAGYALVLPGFGASQAHAEIVAAIRDALPPLFELVTPMPYVALQQLIDEATAWGFHVYEKATYVEDLTDDVIDVIVEHGRRKNSPLSLMQLTRLDGAYSRVGDDETAFGGGRSPRYSVAIVGMAPDPDLLALDRNWVREVWDALRPHAIGNGEGYVNMLDQYGEERMRATYGNAKYERLARIKGEYDPGNLLHLNANIKPA